MLQIAWISIFFFVQFAMFITVGSGHKSRPNPGIGHGVSAHFPRTRLPSDPPRKIDLTSPFFQTPIKLTNEEIAMSSLNKPVTIEYVARPEQLLVLMRH